MRQAKKILVSQFMHFNMVDNKHVVDQLHEIQHVIDQLKQKNIRMDESFVVLAIIDKLPTSWKDFKKSLKT